ncbi:MAG: carboxypeptidase regulatory-like domain-containing protein, partial [Bacteroidales bacterium]|nr:carboxypeptidase regulatory-like domain-containing protein [Bacteroidales bacterium]
MKRFLLAFATLFAGLAAYAQVTTSSMSGQIADEFGEPLIGAAVVAVHEPSGTQYYAITNNDGRYTITGMRSGGPYKVEISFIGMATEVHNDVTLLLGEIYTINANLKSSEQLNEVVVVASTSKFTTTKTGAGTNISLSQMEELPSVNRSIQDIAKLSPYANGMSFAGADGRSTNFTVDGANFNNNFG